MKKHIADKICDCNFCMILDCMWGDPALNKWEAAFVKRTARFGWQRDYTPKEKNRIRIIFKAQRKKYLHTS